MKKFKITTEQYNNLFTKNLTESVDTKNLSESVTPELTHAIERFIESIWLNPSQRGLSKFFIENGITWGEIVNYFMQVGLIASIGAGIFKVKNYFKTKFSKSPEEAMAQKMGEIKKMAKVVEKDPKAPWNVQKAGKINSQPHLNNEVLGVGSPEPNEPDTQWSPKQPEVQHSSAQQIFKPVATGKEIAILQGPDGMYVFDYPDIPREEMPNPGYKLDADDIADYVNENIKSITKGQGLRDFESGVALVKIDEELKNELINLYSYDHEFVAALQKLQEITSAGSSGAFTGPISLGSTPNISKKQSPAEELGKVVNEDEEPIEEVTGSSSSGSYVQPAIWAKNKKNWAAAHKTQYPHGEMVDFDPCTRLNNNKAAQNGKCSQGAVDNVVKTHSTKQSVISKTVYETIAKKTGRTVEDVQKVIESKVHNNKSLA